MSGRCNVDREFDRHDASLRQSSSQGKCLNMVVKSCLLSHLLALPPPHVNRAQLQQLRVCCYDCVADNLSHGVSLYVCESTSDSA